jgi:hypothetical protein
LYAIHIAGFPQDATERLQTAMSHWKPDSPVEQEDGTLRCKQHGLEICGKCCVDYTFMHEVLANEGEPESDDSDLPTSDMNKISLKNPETESQSKCAVCSVASTKHCARCKSVHCKLALFPHDFN